MKLTMRCITTTLTTSILAFSVLSPAQAPSQAPASQPLTSSSSTPAAAQAVSYPSVTQLNLLLGQVQQFSERTQADLAKTRIDRWKTDSNTKRQTQGNVESLTRNLHDALPEMVSTLRASPENLAATFKLYRNLDALYDVFTSVTESAGAFGPKDEFQSLDNDLTLLEEARRGFADRMATLSADKETQIATLRTKVQQMQEVVVPPKKTVVDDTIPPPVPVKKKIRPKPKTTPAAPASTTTAAPATTTTPN
jgi:hypothetical protein